MVREVREGGSGGRFGREGGSGGREGEREGGMDGWREGPMRERRGPGSGIARSIHAPPAHIQPTACEVMA